ncbi:hypothetical protein [Agromyces silvae]|uniref:hypothetical protein n=1 Tax=Agromyces silvae TaxID=3388266 RepID=UPI00280A8163|nr:hypothetical protein [Agromyces protaetiae]
MQRSSPRVLSGLCAVALSAAALGAATPALASETMPATPQADILIVEDAVAYSSPRLDTAVAAELQAGDVAPAYCVFTNAGLEWVKIFADDVFGYVQSTSVEDGVGFFLPRQCASEIETFTLPAPGMTFATPAWGVPLEGFTCPPSFPFLDGRVRFRWTPFVDFINNWNIPGVQAQRPDSIGIDLGTPVAVDDPHGSGSYIGGYTGGSMTNSVLWSASAKLTATCTNNATFAVLAPN